MGFTQVGGFGVWGDLGVNTHGTMPGRSLEISTGDTMASRNGSACVLIVLGLLAAGCGDNSSGQPATGAAGAQGDDAAGADAVGGESGGDGAAGQASDDRTVLLDETLAPGVSVRVEVPIPEEQDLPSPYTDISVELVEFPDGTKPSPEEGTSALPGVLEFGPDGAVFPLPLQVTVTWPESGSLDDEFVAAYVLDESEGRWEGLRILDRGPETRSVILEMSHFTSVMLALPTTRFDQVTLDDAAVINASVGVTATHWGTPFDLSCELRNVSGGQDGSCVDVSPGGATSTVRLHATERGFYELMLSGPLMQDWKQTIRFDTAERRAQLAADGWAELARRFAPILMLSNRAIRDDGTTQDGYKPTAIEDLIGSETEIQINVAGIGHRREFVGNEAYHALARFGHVNSVVNGQGSLDLKARTFERVVEENSNARPTLYWTAAQNGQVGIVTYWMLYPYDMKARDLKVVSTPSTGSRFPLSLGKTLVAPGSR